MKTCNPRTPSDLLPQRSNALRDPRSCLQKMLDEARRECGGNEADALVLQIRQAAVDCQEWVTQEDVENAEYVINGAAEEVVMVGNDGRKTTRDKVGQDYCKKACPHPPGQGHAGFKLDYFHNHPYARTAQLQEYEVNVEREIDKLRKGVRTETT